MSQSSNEAERMLVHIIENQSDLFKQPDGRVMSFEDITLFCATFLHDFSNYVSDIKNNQFPPKRTSIR
jgi:hypothetical protein